MAVGTTSRDAGMVHGCAGKTGGALMASLATRRGRYMVAGFAKGFGAVMTSSTARGDAGVVHRRTAFEAGSALMAGLAGSSSGNVGAGFCDYIGVAAAVAGRTTAGDSGVVHRGGLEGRGALMASLAGSGRWDMCRWLT